MQIFKKQTNFDFMGKRNLAMVGSVVLVLASVFSLSFQGLNFGLDFTGGTLVEVRFKQAADLNGVRDQLQKSGLGDFVIQNFGTTRDVLIRLAPKEGLSSAKLSEGMIKTLRAPYNEVLVESALDGLQQCSIEGASGSADCNVQIRRVEFVGPQIGDELAEDGGLAMLYALIGILIYVAIRFEYRFAVGSVIAVLHDVLITLGIFSILKLDFDLTVLAAILAVIGYSLNDTIVVFDRIRENFRKMRKGTTIDIVNASLNQTLSRTLMTSFTTMIVLIALVLLGGELIHNFAVALITGVIVGTYSSIYVASSTAVALGISKEDLMAVKKEGTEIDDMP